MDPAMTHIVNMPDGTFRQIRHALRTGEIISTWCSVCGHATRHKYDPNAYPVLVCLECAK